MLKNEFTKNNNEILNILEFEVAGKKYGIDVLLVHEIIQPLPYTNLPHMNRNILGLIQLNGEVLPLVSMRKVLNAEEGATKYLSDEKVIIVIIDQQKVGFHVDQVSQLHRTTFEQIDENKSEEIPYTIGKFKLLDDEIVLLDIMKIVKELNT